MLCVTLKGMNTGIWQFDINIVLDTPKEDVELRFGVKEGTRLTVDGIEISLVTEECSMATGKEASPEFLEQFSEVSHKTCDKRLGERMRQPTPDLLVSSVNHAETVNANGKKRKKCRRA